LFLIVEFGAFSWIIWQGRARLSAVEKRLFAFVVVFLTILPIFRVGIFNDLVMRASIPSLFIVSIFLTRMIIAGDIRKSLRVTAIIALIFGSVTVYFEYKRQITRTLQGERLSFFRETLSTVDGMSHFLLSEDPILERYYIGNSEACFFRKIAQPNSQ
jgi:hypothetical protein